MSVLDAIGGLIDSAKRLRSLAEELQSVELKSRIVDEIVQLQELREQAFADMNSDNVKPTETVAENSQSQKSLLPGDENPRFARLEPSAVGETYSLSPGEDSSVLSNTDEKVTGSDTELGISSTSDTALISSADVQLQDLPEEQRFAVAQARIAELEPLHQVALKKMNDVLSEEQTAAKRAATKKGRKAGLKGKELQGAVMAALDLTEEQQQQMASAREELLRIRHAISHQVEGLMSKEQLDQTLRGHRTT